MKKIVSTLSMMALSIGLFAQNPARIQVIHNSPDPALDSVDVYIGDTPFLTGFSFRNATAFMDAPSQEDLIISVVEKGESDTANFIYRDTIQFAEDETYVIIASGLLDTSNYSGLPYLSLEVFTGAREVAASAGDVDVLIHHGSPDAAEVLVNETSVPAGNVVPAIAFPNFTAGYMDLIPMDYELEVMWTSDSSLIGNYAAQLLSLGLEDSAIVVFASGFSDVANVGPSFGIFAALANGTVVQLPEIFTIPDAEASVQFIHNSPDPSLDTVHIYVNDSLYLENFSFRSASTFINIVADENIRISIVAKDETDTADALYSEWLTLDDQESYVAIVSGIADTSVYSGLAELSLEIFTSAREAATTSGNTDFLLHHGSPDAAAVLIDESTTGVTLTPSISFPEFALDYEAFTTQNYVLEVRLAADSTLTAVYAANFLTDGLADSALVIIASGFADTNNAGASFGLFGILPNGTVFELPAPQVIDPTARVQLIHNSADASISTVEFWVGDSLYVSNFNFGDATEFIDLPAGDSIELLILTENATDTIYSQTVEFVDGETYVIIASGLVDNSNYSPFEAFELSIYTGAREVSLDPNETDILFFHGSTDAPTINVDERTLPLSDVVTNLSFRDFDGYLEVDPQDYEYVLINAADESPLAVYLAPLASSSLEGQAIVVFAAGFVDSVENNNGPGFLLKAAFANGDVIDLPVLEGLSVEEVADAADAIRLYPNPAQDMIWIDGLPQNEEVLLELVDMTGRVIKSDVTKSHGEAISISVNDQKNGIYLLRINGKTVDSVRRVIINH